MMNRSLSCSRLYGGIGLGAVLLLATVLLAGYYVPAFEGVDQNGYLLLGRRFAETGDAAKYTSDPFEFVSGNTVEAREGVYYGKYPTGYPLLCAFTYRLGGPSATFLVNPVLAVLGVLGMFVLGRMLLGTFGGLLGAMLLATNPVFGSFALNANSHAADVCFALWTIVFGWRWLRQGGWGNAIAAGALAGYAVSVRYTEALLIFPLAALAIWRWRDQPPEHRPRVGRELAALAVAGLVAMAPLIAHHWVAYGSPFISGYSLCQESTGFGWKWFKENWWTMLSRMDNGGLVLLFPVGLLGLVALAGRERRPAALMGLWFLPVCLVYTAYYWAPANDGLGYIRFFVGVFPPLIIGALALLPLVLPSRTWQVGVTALFVVLVSTTWLKQTTTQLDAYHQRLNTARLVAEAVTESLPTNAVVFANQHVLNFVEFYGDYTLYADQTFERGAIKRSLDVLATDDPHPFQREKAQRIVSLLGDKNDSELLALQREVLAAHDAAARPVVIIASDVDLRRWRGRVGSDYGLVLRRTWVDIREDSRRQERVTVYGLYQLVPRAALPSPTELAALEDKLDRLREEVRLRQAQYQARYPNAREEWNVIAGLHRDIRDLDAQLRDLRNKARAAGLAGKPNG